MRGRPPTRNLVTIRVPRAALDPGLAPFQAGIDAGAPMVMLSSATYTALGPAPGAWSPPIIGGLLRSQLGFDGVVITDSLDSAAGLRGWATPQAALRSAAAGADLLLITGSTATSQGTYVTLVAAARSGALPRAGLAGELRPDPGAQASAAVTGGGCAIRPSACSLLVASSAATLYDSARVG